MPELLADGRDHRLLAHRFDGAAGLFDVENLDAMQLFLLDEIANLDLGAGGL